MFSCFIVSSSLLSVIIMSKSSILAIFDIYFLWKIYFKGWNNRVLDKKTARNFDKTEKLLGKRVADYCREHNISSMWSDKTSEKKKVTYPWQNK